MLLPILQIAAKGDLQRRLYDALRQAILSGELAPGTRLPPSRHLAEELGIARQTVVLAYERLALEGYLSGRVGAGTYVSTALAGAGPPRTAGTAGPAAALPHSAWASRAMPVARSAGQAALWTPAALPADGLSVGLDSAPEVVAATGAAPPAYDFRPGVPDWEAFPQTQWRRLLARRWRAAGRHAGLGQYGDPAGYAPLRAALATYLAGSRGVRCTPDQVVIVSGSQQALDLLARVCLDPGDVAVVEEPGYPDARAIFAAAGARLRPVPVDGKGMLVHTLAGSSLSPLAPLPRRGEGSSPSLRGGRGGGMRGDTVRPKLVYVTPSHQYPAGVTLSLARRLELLDWAAANGALVVEDDYDSELRYEGRPLPALQGLDGRGCVAYVGSCSSVLFPPLRVGWIVAPPALVPPLTAAKWLADRQTSTLDQQVLADFIAAGDLARHLRRSRVLYGRRREALAAAVARHLGPQSPAARAAGGACTLAGEAAGLQTPLYLPLAIDERLLVAEAARHGVGVYPLGPCYGPALLAGCDGIAEVGTATAKLAAAAAPSETWQPYRAVPPHAAPDEGRAGEGTAHGEPPRPGLLLGFAAVPEAGIEEGVRRLAAAICAVQPGDVTREAGRPASTGGRGDTAR